MAEKYQHKVKLATWEEASTHCVRNDISGGGSVLSTRVIIATPRNGTQAVLYGETRFDPPLRLLFLQCATPYRPSSTAAAVPLPRWGRFSWSFPGAFPYIL